MLKSKPKGQRSHSQKQNSQGLKRSSSRSKRQVDLHNNNIKKIKTKNDRTKQTLKNLKEEVKAMKKEVQQLKSNKPFCAKAILNHQGKPQNLREGNTCASSSLILSPKLQHLSQDTHDETELTSKIKSNIQITEDYLFCEGRGHEDKENINGLANEECCQSRKLKSEQANYYIDYYLRN